MDGDKKLAEKDEPKPVESVSSSGSGDEEKIELLHRLNFAHEIGLNESFALSTVEPPENSLEKIVKDAVHSAFWDVFRTKISQDPPDLTMAFMLLNEIKEGLHDVMLPHQIKLRNEVDTALDFDLLKQEALHGALDVMSYAKIIIGQMKRLCAPIRDKEIDELLKKQDVVEIFKGILELLKLMKIDMMNFTLFTIRPEVVSNQMEYEKQKMSDYLQLSGGSIPATEAWLKRNIKAGQPLAVKEVLYEAFLELLTWDSAQPYPETLILDEERLTKLKLEYYRLIVTTSVVLLVWNCLPPQVLRDSAFKEDLKRHISAILQEIQTDEELRTWLPTVAEFVTKEVNVKLAELGLDSLNEAQTQTLLEQVTLVAQQDNRVRQLLSIRVKDYLKLVLQHPGSGTSFPAALIVFKEDLERLSSSFMNIVTYNINICFEHYKQILKADCETSAAASTSSSS